MDKVIVITGPTAIGKTALAIEVAKKYNGEIINADASQFKRSLNIGTAKITQTEQQQIPHHLIDIIDANQFFSVKDYQEAARKLISDIISRGKTPLIVGGSGLYISSTIYDYQFIENVEINEEEYSSLTNEELHKILEGLNSSLAEQIHPNNRRRVIRYIELSKRKFTDETNVQGTNKVYDALVICLQTSREVLYDRINNRFQKMIDNGWVDEVKDLIKNNIDVDSLTDIGYREIKQYIEQKITYEELANIVKQNTRHYAKRQMTWFRNKLDCVFLDVDYQDETNTEKEVFNIIDKFIKK